MAGITGTMAMTVRVSTTTTSSGNGTGSHVTQLGDLQLHSGATAFQVNQRIGHAASSYLAYHYAGFQDTKKENSQSVTSTSRTPSRPARGRSPGLCYTCGL